MVRADPEAGGRLVGADWLASTERTSHMPANNTSEPHAGRVALVTGTSRGIGQAIAVGLAQRGARVVLADRGDASETIALIAGPGHRYISLGSPYRWVAASSGR